MDPVRPYEQLGGAEDADETAERTLLDPIEERIHDGEQRARTRSLEPMDEGGRVAEEAAARGPYRGYERVLSGHGPRSSSTYACGFPP